jgi:amino acid adenylation domain-containing protein
MEETSLPQLSPVKRTLLRLEQLEARLADAERSRSEPIAVIGMSCRFPGGCDNAEAYWQLLRDELDAITEVPPDRWDINEYYHPDPETPGKMSTRHGGFLENVDRFDAAFFRITPREAASLDPQQRLLLEVSWEALEDAQVPPDTLHGSATGVFVGVTTNDYAQLQMQDGGENRLDSYFFTGNPLNTIAGRVSYFLGLHGPSMALDTACSSSLVSIHLACQSLRAGECEMALAGGVNLILSPTTTIAVSGTRALAPDGRSKTFDAAADGFVRSEGCGVVVLKKLSAALVAGDPILAVIRGSAVNHDGASGGFTVPNGKAQEAVIRRALGNLAPSEVDYVEAHGTGTGLGDPIEVKALAAVFGEGRQDKLRIGSVKTNIGHAESAAGIAGVIKVILALQHKELPAHLHFNNPSPLIPWADLPVEVTKVSTPWLPNGKRRIAGVSAFGASGVNAHVVIEEAPAQAAVSTNSQRPLHPLVLSAKSERALKDLATRYAEQLGKNAGIRLEAVAAAAATGRSHLRHRLGIAASTNSEAVQKLNAFATGQSTREVHSGNTEGKSLPRIAFLFTGQGAQYQSMGQALYNTEPVFRQAVERCSQIASGYLSEPLLDVMYPSGEAPPLIDQTAYCQPAMFTLEYALVELLKSWGVRPDAVMGHSLGEYAAACVAGVFSLEDGLKLVTERARLMQALPPNGGMAAIFADEQIASGAIEPYRGRLSIAAINGPGHTVISGEQDALATVLEVLAKTGVEARRVNVSHAFHSQLIDPMLNEFEAAAAKVCFSKPSFPIVSNLTGAMLREAPDALYWRNHSRQPVLFASGMAALFEDGCDVFLEIGPKPVLTTLARACSPAEARPLLFAPILAAGTDWETAIVALLKLYQRGAEIDWHGFHKDHPRALRVPLPTYPFQRKRFWFKEGPSTMSTKQSAPPTPAKQARRDMILDELRTSVAALIQAEVSEVNVQLPFLEMGADSLVLVEAIREIENRYGLKLAIRRFFEDLATIEAVADFVHNNLPEDSSAAADNRADQEKIMTAGSPLQEIFEPPSDLKAQREGASAIEQVLIEQNRTISKLMSQQMDLLREALGQNRRPQDAEKSNAVPIAKPAPLAAALGNSAPVDEEKSAPLLPWGTPAEKRAQGLAPAQQKHLEDLIQRYSQRTRKSKESVQQSRASLADSRATVGFRFSTKEMLYPIVGKRSAGSRLWDIDDNEYIDFTMGFGVHLFGHTPSFINEAVAREFKIGIELGARSNLAGEVAERFVRVTGHDRVAFTNSGTEAVMAAMRLARAGTGREKIVIFNHSYHGHADGTLAAPVRSEHGIPVTQPLAPGVPGGVVESVVVLEYGTQEALETIRALGVELAAVMVEPVQSRNPALQPVEFLRELRKLTEASGAALIFDEMITGFRVHPAGAQGLFGIQADLACYGKIIGGGLPLGLVAGKRRFMDGIDGGMWSYGDHTFPAAERTAFGGTFCQHPLAMAAAQAVLRKIEEEGPLLQERLNERTVQLADTLNRFFETHQVPMRVTYFGSMFRFEFSANLDLFFYHMLEKGIYIWEWRTCFLSTAHTEEDLNDFLKAVKESVAELRSGGFIAPATFAANVGSSGNNGRARSRQFPTSEAQKQLWLLSQIDPEGSLAYNVNATVELKGKLNAREMISAVKRLSVRHEALRTTVAADGESQIVHEHLPPEIRELDYSSLSPEEREMAVQRCRLAESEEAFDLLKGPLFRALLIRLEDERYLLSLTAHHIICDGTTMGVLLEEMAQIYAGGGDRLPTPMQFPAYVRLCAQARATPEMNSHRDYWLAQVQADLPVLNLPVDRPRPAMKTYHGGRVSITVARELSGELRSAARKSGGTLFMFLLAAFEHLLARYCGQDEVVTGIPVMGRPFPGSERVVGYCTHLLPLRSKLRDKATVGESLQQSRTALLEALEHQDFPFSELIQHLKSRRDSSLPSVVSTVFNLEPVSALPAIAGLKLSLVEPLIRFTAFDLSVNIIETGEELQINCDYNTGLFDAVTIERLLNVYQIIARGMAVTPTAIASRLPILPESDRRLFDEWNATAKAHPTNKQMHELFELQALTAPDKTAIIFGETRISYGELNKRAERLACKLVGLGVGPEVLVGVCADRRPEMIVGLLAVLKAGGAYVPMDPAYPKARLQLIMEDASMPVILTHSRAIADLPQTSAHIVDLDADWTTESAPALTRRAARPDNLAYVIYTSGSSGRPQGVAIEHRSAVEFFYWIRSHFTDEQMACVLASASICFDLSVFEIFGTLSWGGTVALAENALHLSRLPAANEVTLVNTVPSVMSELLKAGGLPPSVKTVNLAGELLSRQLADRIYEVETVRSLYNLYGPSEDTTYSTATLTEREDGRQPSIGRPLPNTKIYILGRNLEQLPIGVTGELFISGAGLARGYLNNPALTSERFIPNPFSDEASTRMYRTGDFARYRVDGSIEFMGRSDNQIKLRGFRIELGETEAILSSHDWVDYAIVRVRGDEQNRQLVAYVASRWPQAEVVEELRRFLRDRLPEYMRPSRFIVLAEFPLLPNGKVDRKLLPDDSESTPYAPPQNEIQEILVSIWQEVLRKSQVGAHDSFFEIGGDSLSATQVVARIKERLNAAVELRDLFLFPAITEMARHVARVQRSAYEPVAALAEQEDYEVSPAQKRFWVQDSLSERASGGTLPASFLFDGPLNVEALEASFRALIERHEILRTVFVTSGREPRQKVIPAAEVTWHLDQLDVSNAANLENEVRRVEQSEAEMAMDLSRGPLFRVKLLRLAETRHVCVCTMHHIISDGWSAEVLLDELSALYEAFALDSPSPLAPLNLQYRDYAHWLNRLLDSPRGEQMKRYWLEQLGGAPARLNLHPDSNGVQGRGYRRKTFRFTIPQADVRRLESTGRRYGATLFMILLSSIKSLFYRHTGQEDIVIGTPIAGRVQAEVEQQVGPYLNVLALRDDVRGGERFDALLERVRETTLDAYANQLYPLDWLMEGLEVRREPGRNPVFDVGFTLQNQRRSSLPRRSAELEISELPGTEIEARNAEALTQFWFLAEEGTDAMQMTVVYNGASFEESTVRHLAEDLRSIIEAIAQDPGVRINRFRLSRQAKRAVAAQKVTIELGTH